MSLETKLKEIAVDGHTLRFGIDTMKKVGDLKNLSDFERTEFLSLSLTLESLRVVAEKIQKIRLNLVPQKQYYDFEVDKLLKKIFLLLVEGDKNK